MHQNLEMNAIEIYKKKLLGKKQSKERFLTQLLSYSITQFISRPLYLQLGYKLKVYFLYYIFIYINI